MLYKAILNVQLVSQSSKDTESKNLVFFYLKET